MSKAMSETAKRETVVRVSGTQWLTPDAPEDFFQTEGQRYCEWCPNKVTRYTKRQCRNGPLLCSRCVDGFDPIAHRQGTRRAKDGRKKDTPPREPGLSLPNLRAIRKERGKSQDWLDIAIDAYLGYTGKVERGIYAPSLKRAKEMAEALGVSLAQLKGES